MISIFTLKLELTFCLHDNPFLNNVGSKARVTLTLTRRVLFNPQTGVKILSTG